MTTALAWPVEVFPVPVELVVRQDWGMNVTYPLWGFLTSTGLGLYSLAF